MKRIVEAELIKHRTYVEEKNQKNILLELTYRVKYQDGSIERIHLPKICLPFKVDFPPEVTRDEWINTTERTRAYVKGEDEIELLPIGNTNFGIKDVNGDPIEEISGLCCVSVQEREADPVEMTLEEVEKKIRI